MSTGNLALDMIVSSILDDKLSETMDSIALLKKRYPSLSDKEILEIFSMLIESTKTSVDNAELVVTAPPSFGLKVKSTKNTIRDLIINAESSILITGYSLSDYFSDLTDEIIQKSQSGVLVRFFVNNIESQPSFNKVLRYKGKFLKIYDFPKSEDDSMSALHAKIICVDSKQTLITSANLSYHGQEGNIEVGSLITSASIGKQIGEVFEKLIINKTFKQIK